MHAVRHKNINLVFPSEVPMTDKELAKKVKEAEKGPFYTSAEVKQALKKWRKKYSR
jgi:hypothetical protein